METTQQFGLRNASLAVDQLPLSVGWFVLSTTTDDDDDDDDVRGDDFLFSGSTTENWNDGMQSCKRSCETSSVWEEEESRHIIYLIVGFIST